MSDLKEISTNMEKTTLRLQEIVQGRLKSRGAMSSRMNELIDEAVENSEKSRSDIISEIAEAASRAKSTIHNILNGQIKCPPIDPVLDGFASVLSQHVSGSKSSVLNSIISSAEEDGCEYDTD